MYTPFRLKMQAFFLGGGPGKGAHAIGNRKIRLGRHFPLDKAQVLSYYSAHLRKGVRVFAITDRGSSCDSVEEIS